MHRARKTRPTFAALVVALLLTHTALAWGPQAHMAVGWVAEQHLTPKAREEVDIILEGGRLYWNVTANWADWVRSDKDGEERFPGNAKWHYINTDIKTKKGNFRPERSPNNVVSQVERWQKDLAREDLGRKHQRNAIRFLGHFTADLHQPMHCCYRERDRGGNLLPVQAFRGDYYTASPDTDDTPNLHAVWDSCLVKECMGDTSVSNFTDQLMARISDEDRKTWVEGSPRDWAWESHMLGVTNAYRFTDGTPLPSRTSVEPFDLTMENYIKGNLPVVCMQLRKAGVRLAHLINDALDPQKKE